MMIFKMSLLEKATKELNQDNDLEIIDDENLDLIDESELILDSKDQEGRKELEFFGYKIFKHLALFQATSVGAVDPGYLIGPVMKLL